MVALFSLLISTHVTVPSEGYCQTPYPTSSEITAEPLDEKSRTSLIQLLLPQKAGGGSEAMRAKLKAKEELCAPRLKTSETSNSAVKAALAITESDLAVEVEFSKGTGKRETEAPGFSIYAHFTKDDILLRSSLPRFPSDQAGLSAIFSGQMRKLAWVEGKKGSDILFMIPETKDCSVQAVAICPRIYVPHSTLGTSTYYPSGIRFAGSGKSDGLFALGAGQKGKMQGSLLATKGIQLPTPWFATDSSNTPAVNIKYNNIKNESVVLPPFTKGTLPLLGASETRLDLGTEAESLRAISLRTTVEVNKFDYPPGDKTRVRGALLTIEDGACYLISRWQDRIK
jgi:hypothetical protein